MDRNRRSSILKVRQHIDIDETTVAGNGLPGASTTTNRRVSFHNVKHVKQYDRDHGKLIDASPLREKITDTMDSDGILTPRGRTLDASVAAANQSIHVFDNMDQGTVDMSLETVNENAGCETMQLFNITREQTVVVEKSVTRTVTERVVERHVAPGSNDTMSLFNMTDCDEKDMTVDQSAVFAVPRALKQNATINKSMLMDLDESNVGSGPAPGPSNNDTMSLFNMSTASAKDMDITNVTMNETFKEPKSPARVFMPRVVEEDNEEIDMELTQMEAEKSIVQNQKTMALNESMDISVAPSPRRPNANDTMALFRSPARADQSSTVLETKNTIFEAEPEDVDMEITQMDEQKPIEQQPAINETMDISVAQNATINNTMALFQSPANQANQSYQQMKIVDEDDNRVEMEITQTEEPVRMSQTMDISVAPTCSPALPGKNDTMAMFQSPATVNQSAVVIPVNTPKPFDVSMEQEEEGAGEGTFIAQNDISLDDQSPEAVTTSITQPTNFEEDKNEFIIAVEPSSIEKEEERAVGQASMMDISNMQDSTLDQKSLILQASPAQESGNPSILHESHVSETNDESVMSPQKTMQLETDMTNTIHEMTPIENEDVSMQVEEQVEIQEKLVEDILEKETTMTSQLTMSFTSANKSKSHLSRRRSLLRESILESPRRIAIENSMITMNIGEMTALSEHRRRKSLQKCQQNILNSSAASLLNESLNVSKGRDIFALNTSVRSPRVTGTPPSGNDSTIAAIPETSSFHMPNFDPAITNMVWLTPEEGEEPLPEAAEFASLIAAETMKAEQEVQRTLQNENLDKEKAEAVRTGQWAKLSHDEKDAVLLARQDAEIRFLEMRLAFASKTRLKYEKVVQEQLEKNTRMAEQLNDIEDMDLLRQEIEELKKRPTEADFRRAKDELKATKAALTERQAHHLAQMATGVMQMRNQITELRMEIEEREEMMARIETTVDSEMEKMRKQTEDIMESMRDY